MSNKYLLALIITSFTYIRLGIGEVLAVNVPSFPSCPNISAPLKVSYDNGTHGIAGSTDNFSGSDKVYQVSPDTLAQCFCGANGAGIQTNWWRVSSLDDSQIKVLKQDGWVYIPNGALWGLEETAYLAKNTDFQCSGTSGSGSIGSSSSSNSGQGSVLGAISTSIGDVLGLAFTGNIQAILELVIAGMAFILGGIILKKKTNS